MRIGTTLVFVFSSVLLASCNSKESKRESANDEVSVATEKAEEQPTSSDVPATESTACTPGTNVCQGDRVVECLANGSGGAVLETCKGACRDGACIETCAINDVALVYVVDSLDGLYSFDPRKLPGDPFRKVGTLDCDTTSTPNSMSVDRYGVAWIGYQSGVVHHASILDAHCAKGSSRPSGAPRTFGMGFVTDGPGAESETLFVAGPDIETRLATLETENVPVVWNEIVTLPVQRDRKPELTGTGDGRLFAYFPVPDRGFVQEIDRASGRLIGTQWKLEGGKGRVRAYAFAHWGGVFYVFTATGGNSAVHAIHMKDDRQELVRTDVPFRIVGAGVSTCAPLLEVAPE